MPLLGTLVIFIKKSQKGLELIPVYVKYIIAFTLAFVFSLYGAPLARKAALKFGIVDKPDGKLKFQLEPVPYLGGLAIYISFLLALALTFEFSQEILGLMLAGTIVLLLGLIDDFGVLTPFVKLLGQALSVFVLIKSGIYIKMAFIPYWLQVFFTFFWMIGIINAFNLIDIMDGLSAGVAAIAALFFFIVSIINEKEIVAIMSIAMAGSLVGFLRFNFNPARIYMGDTGSMFIGLMLGALAMIGRYTGKNDVAVLSPVLILGVPIFDTLFVMYIRYLRGIPMFLGSKDHFALRLRNLKLSVRQIVFISYGVTLVLGILGLIMMYVSTPIALSIAIFTALAAIIIVYLLRKVDMGK